MELGCGFEEALEMSPSRRAFITGAYNHRQELSQRQYNNAGNSKQNKNDIGVSKNAVHKMMAERIKKMRQEGKNEKPET